MENKEIPVYLFTGFLESGKTYFCQDTLADERFNMGEPTLLLVCEEGELEYEPEKFAKGSNVFIETIDEIGLLNPVYMMTLAKKYSIERVMIEYNGMWPLDNVFAAMPDDWVIYQEFSFADARTYESYNQNMRQQVYDKLKTCDLIVFNRCQKGKTDQMALHKIVRGVSRRAQIAYEYEGGKVEYDNIEDPLPFDVNAPVIEVEDRDFALFYRDLGENMEQYKGKTVKLKGFTSKSDKLPAGSFVIGRQIMTCCVEDIRYAGLACEWNGPRPADTTWVLITAKIEIKRHKVYGSKKGPVFVVTNVEPSVEPEDPVATFY